MRDLHIRRDRSGRVKRAAPVGKESLRVYPALFVLGRVRLQVDFLLAFLFRRERGTILRQRRGRRGSVAGLALRWL